MRRALRIALWVLLVLLTMAALVVRSRYGGGRPCPDRGRPPILLEVILRSRGHIAAQAPYHVYRFWPGIAGVPDQ